MGPAELLLVTISALGGGAVLAACTLVAARRRGATPTARPPLPRLPLFLALLTVAAAPPLGLGLGGHAVDWLVLPSVSEVAELAAVTPRDLASAHLRGAGLVAAWLALPGLLATGWLLMSRSRSWRTALWLGGVGWAGFGAGLGLGWRIVLPAALPMTASPMPGFTFTLDGIVGTVVAALLAFGGVGACGPVVWVLAAGSRTSFVRVLAATSVMPAGALLLAALTTPPDLLTQLVMASLIGLSWLAGLAGAAATVTLRQGRGTTRRTPRDRDGAPRTSG